MTANSIPQTLVDEVRAALNDQRTHRRLIRLTSHQVAVVVTLLCATGCEGVIGQPQKSETSIDASCTECDLTDLDVDDVECVAELDTDLCERVGVECGPATALDACGTNRSIDCGTCGANAACQASACACDEGFDNIDDVCTDLDRCMEGTHDCDENATCRNTPGAYLCECAAGWSGTGQACDDDDECALATATCDVNATCTNNPGAYSCECQPGFTGDGTTCLDANECATDAHDCDANATCSNTAGAFTCTCNSGFVGNGRSCDAPTSCTDDGECGVNALCDDAQSICLCDVGWTGDGVTCSDIDECANGVAECGANASCNNTPGSHECTCDAGYEGDGAACSDIDECAAGADNCHARATCSNVVGSFQCSCNPGWSGNGPNCSDINECADNTDTCGQHATCSNTPGSFECACSSGFTGDGTSCSDIDECATGADNCDVNATCSNTPGLFSCTCNDEWFGDGRTCLPVGACDPNDYDQLLFTTPLPSGGSGAVYGAPLPGGGAVIGWSDGSGGHLTEVDASGATTGVQHDFAGSHLYGVAAHANGRATLVARGSDILALLAFSPAGAVQIDQTILGDVPHDITENEWFGPGIRYGRLTWTGSEWATYNTVQRLWADDVAHYGDTLRYYDDTGGRLPGGWGWGCSHSMEVRIAHNGSRIGPVCSSDCYPTKGVHFNHRSRKLYDDPASTCTGGYATSLGGLVSTTDGFWVSFTATHERQSHDVALVKVNNDATADSIVWHTEDSDDDRSLHMAMYGPDLLLGWSAGGNDWFVRADPSDGTAVSQPVAVAAAELTSAGDFFVLAGGEVAWPARAGSGVVFNRLTFCP